MNQIPKEISSSLDENVKLFKSMFEKDKTIVCHLFEPTVKTNGKHLRCALFYADGMVNSAMINENLIKPIITFKTDEPVPQNPTTYIEQRVLQMNETKQLNTVSDIVHSMLYGDSVVFCDGGDKAIVIGTKGFLMRSISEPSGESYIKGPREGFTEPMLHNLGMMHRKLRTHALKIEYFSIGETSKTMCTMCYLDGIVDRQVLSELRSRLTKIKIDGILDTNYIGELIRDNKYSPFRTIGSTERPDVLASKLLEGRIGIFVDGSPVAITVPFIFMEHFQSGEDYYSDFQFASANRLLRIIGFFLAISVAPIYVALVTYQQEFLPLTMLLSIASARQGVPLPTFFEALIMILAFEILREAGARTSAGIGKTLSVVGGLVVGQAAVEARVVSAPMLIVVALSAICGLIVPKLKAPVSQTRFFLLILSSTMGLYGYTLGMICLCAHIAKMHSFGISSLSSAPFAGRGNPEDSFIRPPYQKMKKFGRFLSAQKGKSR